MSAEINAGNIIKNGNNFDKLLHETLVSTNLRNLNPRLFEAFIEELFDTET